MLYGKGKCFSAGADIGELAGLDDTGLRAFHSLREETFSLLEDFPCPTFAVIDRYALGTGLASSWRYAVISELRARMLA
jgi:enoyl-CoA hydratase/carnithine racemase